MRKESVKKTYFKVLSSNLLRGIEENHDITEDGRSPRSESNPELSAKQRFQPLDHKVGLFDEVRHSQR